MPKTAEGPKRGLPSAILQDFCAVWAEPAAFIAYARLYQSTGRCEVYLLVVLAVEKKYCSGQGGLGVVRSVRYLAMCSTRECNQIETE